MHMQEIFLGKNLQFLRKSHGLSQDELSELLNKNRATISAYERNKIQPPLSDIWILATRFRISIGDFIAVDLEEKSHGSPEYLKTILERLNNESHNVEVIQTLKDVSRLLEELAGKINETSNKVWQSAKALEEKAGIESPKEVEVF